MKHVLSTLALGAIAALCAAQPASASEAWADTATHVVDTSIFKATKGEAMKPGEALRISVALNIHDKAGLDAQVAALTSGRSKHLSTPDEFLAHYAPTQAEAQAVVDHLRQAGFTHVQVAKNRLLVTAEGTAAAAKAAFNTDFSHYTVDGRDAYANTSPAQVPAHLASIVHAVLGLQNVVIGHTMNKRVQLSATPDAKVTKPKGVAFVHEAPDFPGLYDANGLPVASGDNIAIFTEGDVTQTLSDMQSFTTAEGWPSVNVQVLQHSGQGFDTSGTDEWDMDTQASLAMAGGQIKGFLLYDASYFDDSAIAAEFNAYVSDDLAPAFNNSWGGCEVAYQQSGLEAAMETVFEIGISQGQTFVVATGDHGSYQCGTKFGGSSWPAVSPWVLAVGGTTLYNKNGVSDAYASETTWSCSNANDCFNLGGTGGGASVTEPVPGWQVGVVGKNGKGTMRYIPDIAMDADPTSGLDLMYYGSFDPYQPIAGTSLAAPLFTGMWTRLQAAHNNTLYFPAMALYGMRATDNVIFHDVTTGGNGGYQAAVGWDPVTGFGSVDAGKFNDFINANPGVFGSQ